MSIFLNKLILIFLVIFFSACSEQNLPQEKKQVSEQKQMIKQRKIDPVQYSRGARLFQLNCAKCHGKEGEGAKDWRRPDENGKNPAPPLNGTGHTWHHSNKALVNVIRNGTGKIGGNMPAWKDKLSNSEITLILTWVTAQWSDEIYTAWYNRFSQK